jgi:hypothetical protein
MLSHEDIISVVFDVFLDRNMPNSEFCRLIFLDSRFASFAEFSRTSIAEFLDASPSFVNRCKTQSEEDEMAEARREVERPAFLGVDSEQIIRD